MFLQFFSIFAKCQSQKGAKKKFEKFYCFFLLRIAKKLCIFFQKFQKFQKFSRKSDSAIFYPLYPPNFMQNEPDKSVDPNNFFLKEPEKLTD